MIGKRIVRWLPLERIGFYLSILCAIHCLSLPIFLFFAPYIVSTFAFNEVVEWSLVISSFLMATILLYKDFKKHRQFQPLLLLGAAVFSKFVEILLGTRSINWVFGLLLGIFVALAYWYNYKHKSTCRCKVA
ncbi:MAG: hypothetical protein RJA76_2257 [Bacteroidota bacterium]|jgi:hypothetical protein